MPREDLKHAHEFQVSILENVERANRMRQELKSKGEKGRKESRSVLKMDKKNKRTNSPNTSSKANISTTKVTVNGATFSTRDPISRLSPSPSGANLLIEVAGLSRNGSVQRLDSARVPSATRTNSRLSAEDMNQDLPADSKPTLRKVLSKTKVIRKKRRSKSPRRRRNRTQMETTVNDEEAKEAMDTEPSQLDQTPSIKNIVVRSSFLATEEGEGGQI